MPTARCHRRDRPRRGGAMGDRRWGGSEGRPVVYGRVSAVLFARGRLGSRRRPQPEQPAHPQRFHARVGLARRGSRVRYCAAPGARTQAKADRYGRRGGSRDPAARALEPLRAGSTVSSIPRRARSAGSARRASARAFGERRSAEIGRSRRRRAGPTAARHRGFAARAAIAAAVRRRLASRTSITSGCWLEHGPILGRRSSWRRGWPRPHAARARRLRSAAAPGSATAASSRHGGRASDRLAGTRSAPDTIDALRADHMGATGTSARPRPASTHGQGKRDLRARLLGEPHTSYAVTSLMTGNNAPAAAAGAGPTPTPGRRCSALTATGRRVLSDGGVFHRSSALWRLPGEAARIRVCEGRVRRGSGGSPGGRILKHTWKITRFFSGSPVRSARTVRGARARVGDRTSTVRLEIAAADATAGK